MTVCQMPATNKSERPRAAKPRDARHPLIRLALTLGFLATLPMTWGADCNGRVLTGFEVFADKPDLGPTVIGFLFFSALLAYLAHRLSSRFARTQLHLVAAAISAHATTALYLGMGAVEDKTAAAIGAILLVGLTAVDALVRAGLAIKSMLEGRGRLLLQAPHLKSIVTLAVAGVGVWWVTLLVLGGEKPGQALGVALAVTVLMAPFLISCAIAWMNALAAAQGLLPPWTARFYAAAAVIGGSTWALAMFTPDSAVEALAMVGPALSITPWLLAPVFAFGRRSA